ncbi:hypothetical protein PAXINDRAFT_20518 [Paxillus involutus ATCC 200175]|uniref:Uncharacterized protein n=1 Tax=Paxillus involutus ATCC 200175 TaxID=664439 RepID=A0A0C9TDK2_PAXIN|nr:hypothetical protein PAXINDRAFT_20518 [Paxillus involutus ATCC 200175]
MLSPHGVAHMHVQVAIPSGPRPKPRLKRKGPNAVHLTEEEDFQLTFNWAKCTIGKLPDPQPDDAEATPPARSNSLEKSQYPLECSKHLEDDDAESAAHDAEDEVEDPPPRSKVNSRCPPTTYTRKDKSKRTSEHSRCLDNDNADHHAPGTEDEEPPPLLPSRTPHAHPPLQTATPPLTKKNPNTLQSTPDVSTTTTNETLADVEHVEQLVLFGDATSTNGHATASPRSHSSSLEWPGSDIDFTQIEEHEDPYEVEPETKAFNEDISNDESDAYKPDNDNEDANKVGEEEEEEEEVLLSPKVIQTKGKARTAPSKVKGGKKKAKRAALLSNLEPTDESDQEAVGRKSKKGPLSKEALTKCEEFGREMEERATALAKKFGKKTRSVFTAASLSTSASRKESVWNMHQSWFFATQGQNDEDVDRLRACQKEHYKVLHDSEEGEEKWDIMRQYYIETAAGVESGPKSSVGRVMAAQDAFAKSAAAFCRLQNLHIFGFVIHTRVEEDSHQASRMWVGSPLVRKIINENHMDLKRMIDWWTTVIKFAHIQDSEEGPSMPAIGSGRVVNPIEYLCRAGKPVRNCNQRMLKAMVLKLLIKRSVLWKRLCHEAENLHFTILNWPEGIPVPDTQFDFHKLDANEPEGEDDGENSNGKGKGKGKKGKGKAVEEPYTGGPLAEAIPLVKSRTCPDKASKILLTVGGLHGKKPLASIVDEHNEDVIDEEWPGLAVKDTGFRNADNSDSARNAAHRANRLPPSTSDRDGCSIERPHSPSHPPCA